MNDLAFVSVTLGRVVHAGHVPYNLHMSTLMDSYTLFLSCPV